MAYVRLAEASLMDSHGSLAADRSPIQMPNRFKLDDDRFSLCSFSFDIMR